MGRQTPLGQKWMTMRCISYRRTIGARDRTMRRGLGDLVAQALARQLMMEEEQAFQLRLQQMAGPGLRSSPQDCGIQPTKDPLPGCGTEWLRGQVSCMPMRPTASRRVTASRLTSKTRESWILSVCHRCPAPARALLRLWATICAGTSAGLGLSVCCAGQHDVRTTLCARRCCWDAQPW